MPVVTFYPSGTTVSVPPGTVVLDAARSAGLSLAAPCGGKGVCGKCLVLVIDGEIDTDSLGTLSKDAVNEGFVLACKSRVKETPLVIQLLGQSGQSGGRFLDNASSLDMVEPFLVPVKADFSPMTIKHHTTVPPPAMMDGLSDHDRLGRQLKADLGRDTQASCSLHALRAMSGALRARGGHVTATMTPSSHGYHLIEIEPGNTVARHYGVAIDLGTTTVAVQLVCLPSQEVLSTVSAYNSQVDCGLDVISRINYAKRSDRLAELRSRVLDTINRLLAQLQEDTSVMVTDITCATISGNTTMIHLLLGLNPETIRLEPYTPTIMAATVYPARDIGLNIHEEALVRLSPAIGSYVGGDITAGMLCTNLAADTDELCLFLDIGTNGEVVLGTKDFLLSCACSAGPAFEGGGIGCGMRAAWGAIDHVGVDENTGIPWVSVIGGAQVKPKGICGSGMVALIANMFRTGWLDAAGKFTRSRTSPNIIFDGRAAQYVIVPAEASGTGSPLVITELDIMHVIRAKASIYSACKVMLRKIDMSFNDVGCIFVAGGFGRSLIIGDAKVIGLVPDLHEDKFLYLGNSSLVGSYMVLVSDRHRRKQIELANRTTYIDLSSEPTYMDEYTAALFLPHTDADQFPTVSAGHRTV